MIFFRLLYAEHEQPGLVASVSGVAVFAVPSSAIAAGSLLVLFPWYRF